MALVSSSSTVEHGGKEYQFLSGIMPPKGIGEINIGLLYILIVELMSEDKNWENIGKEDEIAELNDVAVIIKDPHLGYLYIRIRNDYSNRKGDFEANVECISEERIEGKIDLDTFVLSA